MNRIMSSKCGKQLRNMQFINKLLALSDKYFAIEVCTNRDFDLKLLARLNPSFCSITWHNNSDIDLKSVDKIASISLAKQLSLEGHNVLLHLAGRNLKQHEALEVLNTIKGIGVRNILAVQGDQSLIKEKDDSKCDFPYAADLVRFIRSNFGSYFCIGVAGYPEKHPLSKTVEEDIKHLKEKVASGADFIITQACFEPEPFRNFFKLCMEADINVPIIPGIFILSSYKSLIAFAKFCETPIPPAILAAVDEIKEDDTAVKEFGVTHAAALIKNLLDSGENVFKGFQIFSLNNLDLIREVLEKLGIVESSTAN